MLEEISDLYLPATAVTRIINNTLPDGTNIGKEARCAIARATSVFSELIGGFFFKENILEDSK